MTTFRTRARALDMLGRQQIAGIPTAISELFKNAHDAYADSVEVDYYRSDGLFVLRDNGLGMTREEFETRWLTLGTESKVGGNTGMMLPPVSGSKPRRPILGEKGIGRLAIAAIGPQVLILTRALRNNVNSETVAAFIHWGLFRIPGIDIDQIEIPLQTFPPGELPNLEDVLQMVASVRENVGRVSKFATPALADQIMHELDQMRIDPRSLSIELGNPSLLGEGSGTQFYIIPADPMLASDIDYGEDEAASPLVKMLIGFTNTMTPGAPPPAIVSKFRDHKTEDRYDDLVGPDVFFTPNEFDNADHHIRGRFDEYGQFVGSVSVYGEESNAYTVSWLPARGQRTECGPFSLNVAYVQGKGSESTLPSEEWAEITRKLNRIGGIYIYRDGIRILPYGNTDYDFLDIEKRRSKHAAYYFFAYRRMLGAVEISSSNNSNLSEKAGREGFRENRAYRQFKEILSNFFVQIAADYFRESGTQSERYLARKSELTALDRARVQREKLVGTKRNVFRSDLERVLADIEKGSPQQAVADTLQELSGRLEAAVRSTSGIDASVEFRRAESDARVRISSIQERCAISKPRGVGLPKELRRNWDAYQNEYDQLTTAVFIPAAKRIDNIVTEHVISAHVVLDRRVRLEDAVTEEARKARKAVAVEANLTRKAVDGVRDGSIELTRDALKTVDTTIREAEAELARLDVSAMDEETVSEKRDGITSRLNSVAHEYQQKLESIREQVLSIVWEFDESGSIIGLSETTEALEEELIGLRERSETDLELTQLGMAIDVINHEFAGTVKSIRNNLQNLKTWADLNAELRPIYNGIRTNFEHLDGYLALFTPLHRRLYRTAIDIAGADIAQFLSDLFAERLRRHSVTLESSASFNVAKIHGYPSTFYPVFVNLVDNAIYWLKDRPEPRVIRLLADGNTLVVQDTGPGILARDADAIFEIGFSRKPGGRGLGLHISRDVLRKVGWVLTLDERNKGGAAFQINPSAIPEIKQ